MRKAPFYQRATDAKVLVGNNDPDLRAAPVDGFVQDGKLYLPAHGISIGLVGDRNQSEAEVKAAPQAVMLTLHFEGGGLNHSLTPTVARHLANGLLDAADLMDKGAKAQADAALNRAAKGGGQ